MDDDDFGGGITGGGVAGGGDPHSGEPAEGVASAVATVLQVAQVASGVIAGVDGSLEGRDRAPIDAGVAVGGALGAAGGALAGVGTALSDPTASAVLSVVGSVSQGLGGVVSATESIVDSVSSILERANRHHVAYAFTSAVDPDAALMVVSFALTERLGAPYVARITLAVEDLDFDPRSVLGRDGTLTMRRGEDSRSLHGVVRSVQHGRTTDRARVFVVELVPALAALALRKDSRAFQDLDVPAILDVVLEALEGYEREVSIATRGRYPIREHCIQYQETDLDFAHRLMEEEGLTYYFDHTGAREKLVVVDDATARGALLGEGETVPFVEQRSESSSSEHVHELVVAEQLRATSFQLRDLDWTRHGERALVDASRGDSTPGRTRELYDHERALTLDRWDGRAFARDDAERQLRVRSQQHQSEARRFQGRGNVVALAPGRTFTLDGHPVRALDGELLVVAVEHRGHAAQLADLLGHPAYGDDEVSYENTFEAIPSAVPFRSPRVTPKPRIHGLLSALVVGASGQEIHSDEHRRVRVQMRWMREGTLDERSSCFVRVLQPWAGARFGGLFLPRVGMEVGVAFLDGDPDRPIVSGCLYNADNPPPYTSSDDWTKSTLKSRSSPDAGDGAEHYNELRFEDAAGGEQIFVRAERDLDEEVLHDHTTHVGRDQTNRVDVDQRETVGRDQAQTVRRDRATIVERDDRLDVAGDRTTCIAGTARLTVAGERHELVKYGGFATYEKQRVISVGGSDRETYSQDRNVAVMGRDNDLCCDSREVQVDQQYDIRVGAGFCLMKDDTRLVLADGVTASSSHPITLDVNGSRVTIAPDGRVQIQAGTELSLICGTASLTLSASGQATLSGATGVTLASGTSSVALDAASVTAAAGASSLELAASGANLAGPIVRIN